LCLFFQLDWLNPAGGHSHFPWKNGRPDGDHDQSRGASDDGIQRRKPAFRR
jgi:hypothetical protein